MPIGDLGLGEVLLTMQVIPFGGLGMWEVLLIMMVLLLVFGAKRLPELGGSLGKGIREFKKSMRELESEFNRVGEEPARELTSGTTPPQQAAAAPAQSQPVQPQAQPPAST